MSYLVFHRFIHKIGIRFFPRIFCCCKRLQTKIDETTRIHDDYYEYINLKTLLTERRRANIELNNLKKIIDRQKMSGNSKNLDKLAKNIDDKLKVIEEKIESYYDDFEKEIRNIL